MKILKHFCKCPGWLRYHDIIILNVDLCICLCSRAHVMTVISLERPLKFFLKIILKFNSGKDIHKYKLTLSFTVSVVQ